MEKLKAKLKKQAGFTMVELLIVVAIIGILAAVSIPLFSNALEKARHGVDAANRRDAISLANVEAIASLDIKDFETAKYYAYVVDEDGDKQGELVALAAKDATVTGGVEPKCTQITGTSDVLRVKVLYDGTKTGDLRDKLIITTNWNFGSDDHLTITALT